MNTAAPPQAVFNYDFDSLTHDDPVIQVRLYSQPYIGQRVALSTVLREADAMLHV